MLLKCLRNLLLLLLEQLLVQTFKSFSWAAAPSPALISLIYLIRSTDLEFLSLFRGVRDTLVSIFCHLGFIFTRRFSSNTTSLHTINLTRRLYVQSFSLLPLCHQSNSSPSLPSLGEGRVDLEDQGGQGGHHRPLAGRYGVVLEEDRPGPLSSLSYPP